MSHLLSGKSLCLFRGDRCLFRSLDFALNPGELMLVEGPNGSGKTSLLRGIGGLLDFEAGTLAWDGRPMAAMRHAFRADLVWLSHKVGFKYDLTVAENLAFEPSIRAVRDGAMAEVAEQLGIARLSTLPFRVLSAGQQRRVALARMLLADARLWMMDEPLTNLDAAGQSLVTSLIDNHLANGGLCVVASHQPLQVDGRVRRVALQ